MTQIVVLHRPDGQWAVKQEGSDFLDSEHETREAAEAAARELARAEGAEVIVDADGDGRIDHGERG